MLFQYPLGSHERFNFSLGQLNNGSLHASLPQEPIMELPEQVERRVVTAANDDLRAETTQALTNDGSGKNY